MADNQPASILGAYGNPDVKTPNIDRLANEGVRFTRAFAVHGMCSPTRATLLTGLLPSQHGVQDWLDDWVTFNLGHTIDFGIMKLVTTPTDTN